jgi:hypothetical protein
MGITGTNYRDVTLPLHEHGAIRKKFNVKGIHYIQEDSPNEIGDAVREFYLTVEELHEK